jgi:lipoyl(octanoyl) transferase
MWVTVRSGLRTWPNAHNGSRRPACYRADVEAVAPVRASPQPSPTPIDEPEVGPLEAIWLGRMAYRDAWALQKRLAGERADGRIGDRLLLVEHPPVLTLGRQADPSHILASPAELARRGIEVLRVERGGEVTYHGPGQLVAYPIIALARRGLLLRPLVRALEAAMVETCAAFGVAAERREGHPGCWIDPMGAPRKIGALGIRVERGVSYHGIALNIDPDLADFALIDPCGMPGLASTSIAVEAGRSSERPSTDTVERAASVFARAFAARLGADLAGFGTAGSTGLALPTDPLAAGR